ncbi:head completion/stabilization protein [Pandoraea sp.]|uniref:head completion/stabilization protein n=1 Tax=Pandoraea sp. TaxID=1883445 RepID=UPI001220CDA3|nr:head completion/stabilization protein [Pandoraea sp.]TAL53833.1 MAG: head completion/stabilization protein [Pandoraea sp.]TAM17086.1 MAG: head completion/stabilization protein [Pandoraea sp.]
MSFIASSPGSPSRTLLANDGFFPAIDLAALRAVQRLDGTVTHERLAHETIEAMLAVNSELAAWRAAQQAAGHATLAEVPARAVDGTSALVLRYRRAVYCLAHASLIERYRNFDATGARAEATSELPPADELRRDARWAVRDILGRARGTVALI